MSTVWIKSVWFRKHSYTLSLDRFPATLQMPLFAIYGPGDHRLAIYGPGDYRLAALRIGRWGVILLRDYCPTV